MTWGLVRASAVTLALASGAAGCSTSSESSGQDPTPTKLDGSSSYEFDQGDLDQAGGASDAVKDYCAGAVSEAQQLGCESHITDGELP